MLNLGLFHKKKVARWLSARDVNRLDKSTKYKTLTWKERKNFLKNWKCCIWNRFYILKTGRLLLIYEENSTQHGTQNAGAVFLIFDNILFSGRNPDIVCEFLCFVFCIVFILSVLSGIKTNKYEQAGTIKLPPWIKQIRWAHSCQTQNFLALKFKISYKKYISKSCRQTVRRPERNIPCIQLITPWY